VELNHLKAIHFITFVKAICSNKKFIIVFPQVKCSFTVVKLAAEKFSVN